MLSNKTNQKVYYTLIVAVAMCFIGHGAFGIITKPIWCNYFAVFGIGKDMAFNLMPILGVFDIALGIAMLVYPMRAIPAWLVAWGIITAMLRPLSGEPFAEFIERAGNYGAPLTLLILSGGIRPGAKSMFSRLNPGEVSETSLMRTTWCLRIMACLLLAGHGWLNLIEKKGLIAQYASLGFSNPAQTALTIGILELLAAAAVLLRPSRPLILALLVWKVCSELYYPRYELFEWVERGGSYGTLLALWFCYETHRIRSRAGSMHGRTYAIAHAGE